ncbi:MAG: PQQ-dependent sugar dehydrogenase [Gammaproteobacteria bacterium]|nr:PQQ-dependent sugar dehydrogenase [Gammaproteobacteria bacterium]MDP2142077.1 PQQ-dependent sugar dehydrogenase [Gammaproteobacteria bacterium]MDP2347238.1 PQQ-dependent sugar dehydrogenase [Gammaproteobacteria bacterium]
MLRNVLKLVSASLILVVAASASAQDKTYYAAYHNYRIATVADGLVHPWSMAWLPNGDMLVTEKPGRLRMIRDGRLLPEAIPGVPPVFYQGQGGLFEILPHPNFEENQWVYLSFAKPVGDNSTTAIVRARLVNDRLTDVTEIFAAQAEGRSHYGGKLAFDNDGYLYLSLGDRQAPPSGDLEAHPAQDLSNHHGVIVRLHDDGRVPTDNPFVGQAGVLPEIWSYGHRSPQGLAVHPMTGDLWMTEHGPQGGDELNLITPTANYGWPVVGYGVNYGSSAPIHERQTLTGMELPTRFWVPSIATSGLMIYNGDKFPMWRGSIFVGALAGERISRLEMDETYRAVIREEELAYDIGRVRDVREGPDGFIYIAIEDRAGAPTAIVRMEPIQ